uniref:Uncharacterized protein n=1 Tax=Anguilla anguilla TaxID=7936 RepID=A0A0E9WRB7_ANGAN
MSSFITVVQSKIPFGHIFKKNIIHTMEPTVTLHVFLKHFPQVGLQFALECSRKFQVISYKKIENISFCHRKRFKKYIYE